MTPLRSSGVLLHPTSLPGPHGIGELGAEAHAFADWLADAGQSIWQVLPLSPTGYGDSPYQSFSSFAGNPLLISLEALAAGGYLAEADLEGKGSDFSTRTVDFGRVIPWKSAVLRRAALSFEGTASPDAEIQTPHTPSGRGGTAAARATGGREPAGGTSPDFHTPSPLALRERPPSATRTLGGLRRGHKDLGRGGTAAARATGGREPAGINFVAFDVVEVLPAYDNAGGITALLGANVAWEMIALLAWRKKMNP